MCVGRGWAGGVPHFTLALGAAGVRAAAADFRRHIFHTNIDRSAFCRFSCDYSLVFEHDDCFFFSLFFNDVDTNMKTAHAVTTSACASQPRFRMAPVGCVQLFSEQKFESKNGAAEPALMAGWWRQNGT